MSLPIRVLVLLTLVCGGFAPGCTTPSGHDLAAGTARRMSETSKTCATLSNQIAQTTGALQNILSNARSDPRESYAGYVRSLNTLAKLGLEARASRDTLSKDGVTYFIEWEKSNRTIGDESLRKKADQRKSDVHEEFDQTQKQLDQALADLTPLVSQLEDLRAYLSSDLSSAGIESLRGRIGDVGSKGRAIQKQLAGVDDSVQRILPDLGARASEEPTQEHGTVH